MTRAEKFPIKLKAVLFETSMILMKCFCLFGESDTNQGEIVTSWEGKGGSAIESV
jgi:hypothetical protein